MFNTSDGSLRPLDEIVVSSEVLHQGALSNVDYREKGVSHKYVDGTLTYFHGLRSKTHSFENTRWDPILDVSVRTAGRGLLAIGLSPKKEETLIPIFAVGSSVQLNALGPFWFKTYKSATYFDDVLENTVEASGTGFEKVIYGLGCIISSQARLCTVPDDALVDMPSGVVRCDCHIVTYDGEQWGEQDEVEYLTFVPVTPVFTGFSNQQLQYDFAVRNADTILRIVPAETAALMGDRILTGRFYATQNAIESFETLNINGIAFIQDIMKLRDFLIPVLTLLRKPFSLKAWAQLILWLKYGVKMGWKDLRTLYEALVHVRSCAKSLAAYRKARSKKFCRYGTYKSADSDVRLDVNLRQNAKVIAFPVFPAWLDNLTLLVEDLGFRLNARNLWDSIPWSFVIDWFVDLNQVMRDVDYNAIIDRLDVVDYVNSAELISTTKGLYIFDLTHCLTGNVKCEVYDRGAPNELPQPPYRCGGCSFLRHWWEGLAIFLSKTAK